jgi:hypothetical protein
MPKLGFLYYALFTILFIGFGIYLLMYFNSTNSTLGKEFFTFFGVSLIILGLMRGFKAFQLFRKK